MASWEVACSGGGGGAQTLVPAVRKQGFTNRPQAYPLASPLGWEDVTEMGESQQFKSDSFKETKEVEFGR